MSTGRPCLICSDSEKTRIASEMIAGGATDGAIAARLGGGLHRMSVSRHRRNHVVAPAKALAAVAGKGTGHASSNVRRFWPRPKLETHRRSSRSLASSLTCVRSMNGWRPRLMPQPETTSVSPSPVCQRSSSAPRRYEPRSAVWAATGRRRLPGKATRRSP